MDPALQRDISTQLDRLRSDGAAMGRYVCGMCVDLGAVTGAGVMLMSGGEHRGVLGTSDRTALTVEDLQFITGEGPCIDACRQRAPVLEPDLTHSRSARWPAFTGPALDAGIRSIFGIPLSAGDQCLGAIDLYRDVTGPLTPQQVSDVTELASLVTEVVLTVQNQAPPGMVATQLQAALRYQAVIHQASGMVSAALDIPVADALVRLRAHAYAVDRSLHDLSRSIVDRTFDLSSLNSA